MRVAYINEEIMTDLLNGLNVRYAPLDDGSYIFSQAGFVAYVLRPDEIYFSLEKCTLTPSSFDYLLKEHPVALLPANKLTPTLDIRVNPNNKALLSRQIGAGWDTFVDMALLEAFDYPSMYQDAPLGPIAITEGEKNVRGYVMATRTYKEKACYYNDPMPEKGE